MIESIRELHSYTIEVESYSDEYAIVRASGELDMASREELAGTLDRFLAPGATVDVDLAAVTFMYSGTVNAIIDAASRADGRVRVVAPTRPVAMIFERFGSAALLVDEPAEESKDSPSFLQMFFDADRSA